MNSNPAKPAISHHTTTIRAALTNAVDEVCGTLARLVLYVMALALMAIVGLGLWGTLPEAIANAPSVETGWHEDHRGLRAFAVSQANLHNKTEAYAVFRHPAGGRRDILRWSGADGRPVAGLAIYRPGGERGEAAATTGLAAELDPDRAIALEAAGVIDTKFGMVALLRPVSDADPARLCLGFVKQIDSPTLRISGWSCQGDDEAARGAAIGCMLNRLVLLAAGRDTRLAEMFAQAELRRSGCPASGTADWINGAGHPRLRPAL